MQGVLLLIAATFALPSQPVGQLHAAEQPGDSVKHSNSPRSVDGWGADRDGLCTRLLPAQKEYVVGQPVRFRLEMKNFGSQNRTYDPQQVDVNGSLIITDPDGKPVPYIGGSFQTMGPLRRDPIRPGETVVLFNARDWDFTDQYPFVKPGRYTVQFRGQNQREEPRHPILPPKGISMDDPDMIFFRIKAAESPIPPSNKITTQLLPGTVPVSIKVPAELVEIIPQGWDVSVNWRVAEEHDGKISPPRWSAAPGTYVLMERHSVYKDQVLRVHIWIAEQKLTWTGNGMTGEAGKFDNAATYLGKGVDGHVYWSVPEKAKKEWPEIRAKVRATLGIASAEPQPERSK